MKRKEFKVFVGLVVAFCTYMANISYVYAADIEIGKNIGNLVLDTAFWLIVSAVIVVCGFSAIKKNIIGVVSSLLIGGIVLYFVKNPEALSTLGHSLAKAIGF